MVRSSGTKKPRPPKGTGDDAEYRRYLEARRENRPARQPKADRPAPQPANETLGFAALEALHSWNGRGSDYLSRLRWRARHIEDWWPSQAQAESVLRTIAWLNSPAPTKKKRGR